MDSCNLNFSKSIDDLSCEPTYINFQSKFNLQHEIGCALDSAGALYCTGYSMYGTLGTGNNLSSYTMVPVKMSGVLAGKTIIDFSTGLSSCVIASDLKPYCWGAGSFGEMGNNANNSTNNEPVAVDTTGVLSGKTILKISAGNGAACVIASDHKAYCWGSGGSGNLGNGTTTHIQNTPVAVDTTGVLAGKDLIDIYTSSGTTCALSSDYKIYCWGDNGYGSVGNGFEYPGSPTKVLTPVEIILTEDLVGKKFRQLIGGHSRNNYTMCALTEDYKAYCWGRGWMASLDPWDPTGIQETMFSNVPKEIDMTGVLLGQKIKSIAVGFDHICVLTNTNLIACWGDGTHGALSGGVTTPSSLVPVEIHNYGDLDGKNIDYLIAGRDTTCAYAENNYYCWGMTSPLGIGLSYSVLDYPTLSLSNFPF